MGKNNPHEIAKEVIKSAKTVFNEKITDIHLFNVTDEIRPMFSIIFVAYGYFLILFNYEIDHFGCCIVFSKEDGVSLGSSEMYENCDYIMFWNEIDRDIRLRIPDKFLKAHGWL